MPQGEWVYWTLEKKAWEEGWLKGWRGRPATKEQREWRVRGKERLYLDSLQGCQLQTWRFPLAFVGYKWCGRRVPGAFHTLLLNLTSPKRGQNTAPILPKRHSRPHEGKVTCPRPHSMQATALGFGPWSIIEICILISLIIATFSCILGISLASPDWYFHAISRNKL